MRCKGMAQAVARHPFRDLGGDRRGANRPLNLRLMQMMSPVVARRMEIATRRREDVLPYPVVGRTWRLSLVASGSGAFPAPRARSRSCSRRTRSRCRCSSGAAASGSTVTRFFAPFARRTRISPAPKSTSFTPELERLGQAEPAAVEQRTHQTRNAFRSVSSTARASSLVSTTGSLAGCLALIKSPRSSGSRRSTSRYRKTNALSAWVWLLALSCPRTARAVRNCRISLSPSSPGCRRPWNLTYRRTQAT